MTLKKDQVVGVGILSVGCGSLFGMVFGAKRIMRALIETLKETKSATKPDKAIATIRRGAFGRDCERIGCSRFGPTTPIR